MSLRYNTFAGATATLGAHENVKVPSYAEYQRATATVNNRIADWEAQFESFAKSYGCDFNAGGVLVVPTTFDMRDVPPRFVAQVISRGNDFALLRNPLGGVATIQE